MTQENFEYGQPSIAGPDNSAGVAVDQADGIAGSQVFPSSGDITGSPAEPSSGTSVVGAAGAQLPPNAESTKLGSSAYADNYGFEKSGDQ